MKGEENSRHHTYLKAFPDKLVMSHQIWLYPTRVLLGSNCILKVSKIDMPDWNTQFHWLSLAICFEYIKTAVAPVNSVDPVAEALTDFESTSMIVPATDSPKKIKKLTDK